MSEVRVSLGPLAALAARYDRLAARGEAPVPGFAPAQIAFVLVFDREGRVVAVHDERTGDGKKKRPKVVEAPQPPKRTVGVVSGLLWDKTSYVLGVTRPDLDADESRQAKAAVRTAKEHEAFRLRQEALLAGAQDDGARALLAFLSTWTPETYVALPTPYQDEMLDQNIAFQLEGDRGLLHDRPALRVLVAAQAASPDAQVGQCLVTGQTAPIARLHPSIKGVPGAQSSGASLVSFNASAFTSYGAAQGDNAPTSELAAFGYGTALNDLLASDGTDDKGRPRYRNRVQIGDATTVFWAEVQGDEAGEAEALLNAMFGGGPALSEAQIEAGHTTKARDLMVKLEAGEPLRDVAAHLEGLRVYVLGLSPNAARLSVRFWHVGSLGELTGRFQAHWKDLRLEPSRSNRSPALWRLLRQLAAQGEAKNIPPNLAGEVMRAILTGGRYPRSLLTQTLMRIRADQGDDKVHELRVALLKAVIVRETRKDDPRTKEDLLVSLNTDELNQGYRLGRLFAVMEAAQAQAIAGVNASIRDRFYGSASATPAHIFPLLLRGVQDHLSKIRKSKPGLAVKYEKAMAEVVGGLDADLPATLDMKSQGLFAIGYYHQRSALYAKRVEGEAELDATLTVTPDEAEDQ
ncbi:type I-C CRISPR-associated protein Cas8c/Csd1 [Caulobacter sp. LARHSG274]